MSYKEIRGFVDAMKELDCPETVDIESFQYPDFKLTAQLLHWLVSRCDPSFQIPLEIEAEQDRVFFLKAITDHMKLRFNIVLDPRKLYMADGHAVRELLKISRLLQNYSAVWNSNQTQQEISVIDEDVKAKLMAKVMDLRTFRKDQGSLTLTSAEMFNMLKKEPENHLTRINALNMKLDPNKVDETINDSIIGIETLAQEYQQKYENIEFDKINLEAKIKKREEELERMQRRFQTMQGSKPVHLDETDKLETELKEIYSNYCRKHILLAGLEDQVRKLTILLDEKEKSARGKDNSDIQKVDDLGMMGLDGVVIDDGFNEDPVEQSDNEPELRPAARAVNVRANVIDHDPVSSDEDLNAPIVGVPGAGKINRIRNVAPGSSDEEF